MEEDVLAALAGVVQEAFDGMVAGNFLAAAGAAAAVFHSQ